MHCAVIVLYVYMYVCMHVEFLWINKFKPNTLLFFAEPS